MRFIVLSNRSLIVLTLLLFLTLSQLGDALSITDDFDLYPPLPIPSSKPIRQKSINQGDRKELLLIKFLSPLKPILGIGIAVAIGCNIAKNLRNIVDDWNESKRRSEAIEREENEAIIQIKKDVEELWGVIGNIQNTQADQKVATEKNRKIITGLQAELARIEQSMNSKIDGLVRSMEDAEFTASKRGVLLDRLQDSMDSVQKQIEVESKATVKAMDEMKAQFPSLLKEHDALVSSKLQKFRADLKQIILNRKK